MLLQVCVPNTAQSPRVVGIGLQYLLKFRQCLFAIVGRVQVNVGQDCIGVGRSQRGARQVATADEIGNGNGGITGHAVRDVSLQSLIELLGSHAERLLNGVLDGDPFVGDQPKVVPKLIEERV